MGEVGLLQQLEHPRDVARKEQVVVAEVADDLARRFRQRGVPVSLPVALALREVEEAHARIGEERLERGPSVVLDAVPDDEQLDRRPLLSERASHRVRQQRRVAVGRDEDGRVGHGASTRPRSRSITPTISAPSRADDFGRGPPPRWATNARSSASSGSSPGVATCSGSAEPVRKIVTYVSQPAASDAVPSAQSSSIERRRSGARDETVSACHADPASSSASRWEISPSTARPNAATGCGTRPRISRAIERSWGVSTQVLSTSSWCCPQATRIVTSPCTRPRRPDLAIDASSRTP